jgi:hypothetical protein
MTRVRLAVASKHLSGSEVKGSASSTKKLRPRSESVRNERDFFSRSPAEARNRIAEKSATEKCEKKEEDAHSTLPSLFFCPGFFCSTPLYS